MKIIISPAKSFKHFDNIITEELLFPEKTRILVDKIKKLSMNEIGNLNFTNDKFTEKLMLITNTLTLIGLIIRHFFPMTALFLSSFILKISMISHI